MLTMNQNLTFFFKEKTAVETRKTILSGNYPNVGFPGYLTSMEKKKESRIRDSSRIKET